MLRTLRRYFSFHCPHCTNLLGGCPDCPECQAFVRAMQAFF
jgi:hypothetical protein